MEENASNEHLNEIHDLNDLNDLIENNTNTANTVPHFESNSNNHNINLESQMRFNALEEIHRATNEEILSLFRQAVTLRERTSNVISGENNNEIEENIYENLMSNKVFLFSPFLIILLVSWLGIEVNNLLNKNFHFKTLESETMFLTYVLTIILVIIVLWNFYLLVLKVHIGFNKNFKLKNMFNFDLKDMLYFNPFYFNMLIYFFDKNYLSTNFDLFINILIAIFYLINFFFTHYISNLFKQLFAKITNLYRPENYYLTLKMRSLFIFLVTMNIGLSFIITYLTSESDFLYVYIIQHKSIYLIIKQISLWYDNESTYKQLDNFYATNEQYYLNSILIKMIIQLVLMIIIVQFFLFGNMMFCKRGAYVFLLPSIIVSLKSMYDFFIIFKNYEDIRSFFDKLDSV